MSRFALELNRLCDERWPGGDRMANVSIAQWVADETGRSIDRQYIWRIRKGHVTKVDADVRDAICTFFDVPTDHFTKANRRTLGEEVELGLATIGFQLTGLRSDDLSDDVRNDIARVTRELGQIFEAGAYEARDKKRGDV